MDFFYNLAVYGFQFLLSMNLFTYLYKLLFLFSDLYSNPSMSPKILLILCMFMWTGFFCGLLTDLFFGSILGFYALIYMYVGFISGYTYRIYYDNDLKVPILLTAAMDFFYNLAVYGFQFLLRGRMNLFTYLYRIIIPEIVYTVFLTVIVYRIFYYINHHFMTPVRKESESIWVLK